VTINRYSLAWVALAAGLLPILVVTLAYVGSTMGGHIPLCFPLLQGCTSISSAGRYGLAYFFFKGGMITAAVLLSAYWILCRLWLRDLGGRDSARTRSMVALGCVAAAFLILYTLFLGSKGDFYNLMRRFGVTIYFSFSYLAQLLLVAELRQLRERKTGIPPGILRGKLIIVIVLLVLGLGSIPISNFVTDKTRPENAVEWNFALLMASYYFFTWRAWRHTRFSYTTSVN